MVSSQRLLRFKETSLRVRSCCICNAMDPISAAASVIGLIGAAAKVSESLFKFIRSVKEAPKLASYVLQEVSDISACLVYASNVDRGRRKE